jgi:alpha-L-fucosidase
MMKKKFNSLLLAIITACSIASGQTRQEIDKYYTGRDQRMKWFQEARFGMFIHWGTYAVLAGEWKEKQVPGAGEWIMYSAKIPVKEYEEMAKEFNPVQFRAEDWVKLASEAGMKYMIITAKHCDGFAMFPSKVTRYNIYDWTKFKRDPLKELENACIKNNLKLGFYYSHWWDWHEANALGLPNTWDFPDNKSKNPDIYLTEKSFPQIKELITNYNPSVMWFDVPGGMSKQQSFEILKSVRSARPNCIINDRIGNALGDYETPEQYIPPKKFSDADFGTDIKKGQSNDFEVCMTLNETWGYKYFDNEWKSSKTIVENLVDIASKGGNYLLNVGPMANGLIPEPIIRVLQEVGKFMKANGESIYGTDANPFVNLPFNGRCTQKPGKLYFQLFEWPNAEILLPPVKNNITKVYLLSDPKRTPLSFKKINDQNILVSLKAESFDPSIINDNCNVLAVEYSGVLEVLNSLPTVDPSYKSIFEAGTGNYSGKTIKYEFNNSWTNRGFNVTGWNSREDSISWDFKTLRNGKYQLFVEYASVPGCDANEYFVMAGNKRMPGKVENTGGWYNYKTFYLGNVDLRSAEQIRMVIKAYKLGQCSLMNLKSIKLVPIIK